MEVCVVGMEGSVTSGTSQSRDNSTVGMAAGTILLKLPEIESCDIKREKK